MATAEIDNQKYGRLSHVQDVMVQFTQSVKKSEDDRRKQLASLVEDMQNAIYWTGTLGDSWRTLIKAVSEDIYNGVDLFWLHPQLAAAVASAKEGCTELLQAANDLKIRENAKFRDLDDVTLLLHEFGNIERWLAGWEPPDAGFLDEVRNEIERGDVVPREELERQCAGEQ